MPPLDTGSTHTLRLVDPLSDHAEPASGDFQTVGAFLRAVRERRGRTVAELAAATRIGKRYLSAIESADYSALPSRPFAIGYVRAYANALELDGEAAAERFKTETPDTSEPLHAPIGLRHERAARRPLIMGLGLVVLAAVIGWNVVQRATNKTAEPGPPPITAAQIAAEEAPAPQGPISLGAPTPPPAEQTTPVPYVTPGMATQTADPDGAQPAAPPATPAVAPPAPPPQVFAVKGQIYGAEATGPAVVLQARKRSSLIVRGPEGQVYFARQLDVGEAYRAPIGRKLTAEVTDPSAFSVYINSQLRGALLVAQTPLDKVAAEIVANAPAEPEATPAPAAPGAAAH